jgi:hypothetical protein
VTLFWVDYEVSGSKEFERSSVLRETNTATVTGGQAFQLGSSMAMGAEQSMH